VPVGTAAGTAQILRV